jgi:hypothetical protein
VRVEFGLTTMVARASQTADMYHTCLKCVCR